MPRILLADDSPHAQRMGERILRDEGYEVVTVTDGETALIRLADVDPDLVLADVMLPRRNGYQICERLKTVQFHEHAKVILTHGMLSPFSQAEADRVHSDAVLMKPFEASALLGLVKPMIAEAVRAKSGRIELPPAPFFVEPAIAEPTRPVEPLPAHAEHAPPMASLLEPESVLVPFTEPEAPAEPEAPVEPAPLVEHAPPTATLPAPEPALVPPAEPEADPELVRAAVILAVDAAMPALVDEITKQVLIALRNNAR